jgi:hypothetical protein
VAWVTGAVAARLVNGGPLTEEEKQVLTLGRVAVPSALNTISSRDPAGMCFALPSLCLRFALAWFAFVAARL